VKKNFAEAVKWWSKVAEQEDIIAQVNLGQMYEIGKGVEQDFKKAVKWYRKAAEQGNPNAQNLLGARYYLGQGVEKDSKQAEKWFRKSAEQGDVIAQGNLGKVYQNGKAGIEKDDVTAYAWWNIAVSNGHATAKEDKRVIARKMTPDQIAKAEELTKEMVKKNPKLIKLKK